MYTKPIIGLFFITLFFCSRTTAQSDSLMQNTIYLGDSAVKIIKTINDFNSQFLFLNIHEDEATSIAVAQDFADQKAINFIYLSHIQTRRINFNIKGKPYSVDPNRIFTKKGRNKTLEPSGLFKLKAKKQAAYLSETILKLIAPYQIVITMHNNTDVNYSIKSYLPGGGEAQNTAQIHINDQWDADDFIYTTHQAYFDYLKAKDVNVILQDNQRYVNDGSLSVYCGEKGIPYLNIEAQKGHYEAQYKLTEIVYEMLQTVN